MKRYVIGIASFLIIWNIFYMFFLEMNFGWIIGIPILLIIFALVVVLSKKCVDFLAQEQHKKFFIAFVAAIVMGIIGGIGYQLSRYMPKTFEDTLGFRSEDIVELRYDYGKEEQIIITDRAIIENVVNYLDDFTYHLKKDRVASQENLQSNSYRLDGPFFVGKNNQRRYMQFFGDEMQAWSDFYNIEGGIVKEDKLLQILEGSYKNRATNETLAQPILTKDMTTGVGILSDYESDDKIIFHGYFGLFVYDLNAQDITLAIDLETTLGTNQIQGSPYVSVEVNQDGSEMILYLDGTAKEDEKMAYYINTSNGSYTYDTYKPFDRNAECGDSQKYIGDTIENITYTRDNTTWNLFKDWKF